MEDSCQQQVCEMSVIEFTRETIRLFEIWDKTNSEVCHGLRECYEDDLYMSEDDFEEITWDGLFEFRYVYSGEVIESFSRLRELMMTEDCSGLKC